LLEQIDHGLHALYRWCGILAAACIVLIGAFVLVNIISRLVGAYVPGMTEGAGYCMAGAGALGLAYTFGEHGHIRVTMLIGRLRGRARFAMELWALLIGAAFSCYVGYYLLRMVYVSYLYGDRSDGSDELLIWIPQVPLAVGFAVFALSLVHAIVVGVAAGRIDRAAAGGGET
jgi:TRAP-type C4-dicarboxylate transport system permease small subunit